MDTLRKLQGLRGLRGVQVVFVALPTPVLVARRGVLSPNRTNCFPISQVLLATALRQELRRRGVPWEVGFRDYKSLECSWLDGGGPLVPYGSTTYGDALIEKAMVGDGLERLRDAAAEASIVCMTANFTVEANIVALAARVVAEQRGDALIIVGGKDASARPEFYRRAGADFVGIGDCDRALSELLIAIYRGEPVSTLVKDGYLLEGGGVRLDEVPALDLDITAGALHRYNESGGGPFYTEITRRGYIVYYETSRGCFRECDFCTARQSRRSEASVEKVRRDIEHLERQGVRTLMLVDDNLLQRLNRGEAGRESLLAIFSYLREHGFVWEFPAGLEAGRLWDERGRAPDAELIGALLWSGWIDGQFRGAFRLLFPLENALEHGAHERLAKMKPIDANIAVLCELVRRKLPQVNVAVLVGFGNETPATIRAVVGQMERIQRAVEAERNMSGSNTDVKFSVFCVTPLPGTRLFQALLEQGRIKYDIERDPELWTHHTSVVVGDTIQPERITEMRNVILERFHSGTWQGKMRAVSAHGVSG